MTIRTFPPITLRVFVAGALQTRVLFPARRVTIGK